MNLNQEPFTDKKVREAFAYAFDRETLCAEIRSGDCSPTLSWIPAGHRRGRSKPTSTASIPEAAVQALAESSYGGPEGLPEITIVYNSDISGRAEAGRSGWRGSIRDILGVELTIEPV